MKPGGSPSRVRSDSTLSSSASNQSHVRWHGRTAWDASLAGHNPDVVPIPLQLTQQAPHSICIVSLELAHCCAQQGCLKACYFVAYYLAWRSGISLYYSGWDLS
jgi:hypothetical protein